MLQKLVETAFGMVATVWMAAYTPEQARSFDVVIDPAFDAQDQTVITESVQAWRRAIPELRMTVSMGDENAPCVPEDGQPARLLICIRKVDPSEMPNENILGLTSPRRLGSLIIFPAHAEQSTVAHELGHAMGLPHSHVCGTLMFPTVHYNGVKCDADAPTREDVRAWHRVLR